MTSKNLFFKRMKQDFEQRIWLPVIFFILGFLTMEMPLISTLHNWKGRLDYLSRAREYLLDNFFAPNVAFIAIAVCVAVVSAISGFAYIHSAKKLDLYHSLPVKRQTLFAQQYVYGVIYYLVPHLLHILICMVICITNGVFSAEVLVSILWMIPIQLLVYLVSYSTVVLAVCLTGNVVISILGSVILLFYSLIVNWLKSASMNYFFETYYGIDNEFIIPAFSPVHMIYNMVMDMVSNFDIQLVYGEYWVHYVKLLIAAAIYTGLALFLYCKRPTEVAGNTMAFRISESVIKTMVVIPISIVAGFFIDSMFGSGDSFTWFVVGAVFGFLLACPLMEVIFRKDVKAIFQHPLQIAFNGVCVVGLVVILQFDLLGYDTYVPDADKVESYAIGFSAIPTVHSSDGEIGYSYRLEEMEIRDNESACKLLEHAAEVTRPMRKGELTEAVEAGDWATTGVEVVYKLKNGKQIYRSYVINMADEEVLGWVNDTYCDMEHRLAVYPVLQDGAEERYVGLQVESTFGDSQAYLSDAEMKAFVEAYRFDLMSLQLDDLREEYPVAELTFLVDAEGNSEEEKATQVVAETVEYYYGNGEFGKDYYQEYGYRIYPFFTRTIELLESFGVEIKNVIPAEDILSMTVTDYTREVYDNDGYMTKVAEVVYTNETDHTKQIEEILPCLLQGGYYRSFAIESGSEENIDVSIRYLSEYGFENHVYCEFKKGEMPDFVKQDLDAMYEAAQITE